MNWRNIKDEKPRESQRIYVWHDNEVQVGEFYYYGAYHGIRTRFNVVCYDWTHWIPAEELAGPEN